MKKLCGKCKKEFAFDQSYCKTCNRRYQKDHYKKHRKEYREKLQQRRHDCKEWWNEYKAALKCCRCGESHPACLDFHHRDPNEKDGELANAINKGWSKERILLEVAKCEVVCSNCHRKHHWNERGPVV